MPLLRPNVAALSVLKGTTTGRLQHIEDTLMNDKSQLPPEQECPFCKTELKSGATVCASCGATYTTSTNGGVALGGLLGVALLFFAYIGFTSSPDAMWRDNIYFTSTISAVIGGVLFWFSGKAANKHEWVRRQ